MKTFNRSTNVADGSGVLLSGFAEAKPQRVLVLAEDGGSAGTWGGGPCCASLSSSSWTALGTTCRESFGVSVNLCP